MPESSGGPEPWLPLNLFKLLAGSETCDALASGEEQVVPPRRRGQAKTEGGGQARMSHHSRYER